MKFTPAPSRDEYRKLLMGPARIKKSTQHPKAVALDMIAEAHELLSDCLAGPRSCTFPGLQSRIEKKALRS